MRTQLYAKLLQVTVDTPGIFVSKIVKIVRVTTQAAGFKKAA